jgi:flagellar biosynthetic protein FliR
MEMTESTIKMLTTLAATVLIIGIKMSAPVLIALFLTNLGLVLLARVAPQTNVFALSFQLKVVIGLVVLAFSMPLFVMLAKNSLIMMESETMKLVMTLNPSKVP